MKLTCVTAVFNAIKSGNRENLIRCVRSVAALKTEHEHLIYDGASTDGTVELLRELEQEINNSTTPHSSLLTIHSEKDTGIYNALNKGVRDAQGEWFYVLGCDDYICHPEVMDRILRQTKDAEILISRVFFESSTSGLERPIVLIDTLHHTPYCHQGVIAQTQILRRQGGFDERFDLAADYEFLLRCHFEGARIEYHFGAGDKFAVFADGGMSSTQIERLEDQMGQIVSAQLEINDSKMHRYYQRGYLPLLKLIPLINYADLAIRTSARNMIKGYIRGIIRTAFYPIVVWTRPWRCKKWIMWQSLG